MAKATVEGTVERVNRTGNGFRLKESWQKREGGEGRRYWSVFPADSEVVSVHQGDTVKVSGLLKTAVSTNDSRFVDHTIGSAQIEVTRSNGPAFTDTPPPAGDYPPTDTWATTPIPDGTPF